MPWAFKNPSHFEFFQILYAEPLELLEPLGSAEPALQNPLWTALD